MNKYVIILIFFGISCYGYGQNNGNIWYFGNNAGLDFNNGHLNVKNDGSMIAEAGCASVCNNEGNLLFYTNGNKVWNRNHNIMLNGDSLIGRPIVNQNSVIIPLPGSDKTYYLFTINNYDTIKGFNYSVIDMLQDNGLGAVVQKNIYLKGNVIQKITAVQHCNGHDYWVIVHNTGRAFYSYLVDNKGVAGYVESLTGSTVNTDIGFMKTSPDGSGIVLPVNNDSIMAQFFTFNNKTGVINSPVNIYPDNNQTYCFGTAFSANSKVMYISTRGLKYQLMQYDISINNESLLNNNSVEIAQGNNFGMQCAPDGKIYIACENRPYLNIINKPGIIGPECSFEEKALYFSVAGSLMGMPNFPQSWFYKPDLDFVNTCYEDTTGFFFDKTMNVDSCLWDFYNTTDNKHLYFKNFSNNHVFENTGLYNVNLDYYHCGVSNSVKDSIQIIPYPVSTLPEDTTIIADNFIVLDAGNGYDSYLWNNGSTSSTIEAYTPGEYYVEINNKGCKITDTVFLSLYTPEIIMPNAFTPNGDGVNDYFGLPDPENLTNFNMSIINRYGTIVFKTNNIYEQWDGYFMGTASPVGTYIWFVTVDYYNGSNIVKVSKKGYVTLIR